MKNKMDDSLFEDVEYGTSSEMDDSLFEDVEYGASQEPEKMGALEAAVTGIGQGASLGLTPIVAGATGVLGELGEDAADLVGLTDDSKLEDQGFDVPDDYEGIEGLMQAYYDARDRQKAQEEQAFEDQPVATMAGNLAGGIASGGAAGGARGPLASILPKAQSVKGLPALTKAGIAAKEGAKAGALAGFGQGDAKLAEGDVREALAETAGTAAGGALAGGALSLGGTGVSKLGDVVADTPLAKNLKLGYDAAMKNLNISDDKQITDYVRGVTKDIRQQISKNFKGSSKKELLEYADEIGIRVSAGEKVDDIIEDIRQTGAFGTKEQKELSTFVDDLNNMFVDRDVAGDKMRAKIQEAAAKKVQLKELDGARQVDSTDYDFGLDEVIDTDAQGNLAGRVDFLVDKFGRPMKTVSQKSQLSPQVDIKKYDMDALPLSELDEIISKVGTKGYQGTEDAATPYAKKLYSSLRELSNNAMEESSLPEKNKKLKALFDGLESLGIKPKEFFSGQETVQDVVENKIQQKLIASPLSSADNKMANFLKYLRRADDALADSIEKESEFASDIAGFVRQSEGEGSVSARALAGPVQRVFAKLGNLVGAGVKSTKESIASGSSNLKSLAPEDVQVIGAEMSKKFGEKATPFINQLNKAVNAPGQRKNALMYGIYQQPAFRKMLEQTGRAVIGEEEERIRQEDEAPKEIIDQLSDVDSFVTTDKIQDDEEKDVGRTPQGKKEVLPNLVKNEGDATFHKKTTPYKGITGPKNTRVEDSSDQGLYYDSLGKLTAGYGDLVTSDQEAHDKVNQSKEEALQELVKNYERAKRGTLSVLKKYDIDPEGLSEEQIDAIDKMVFQLGADGVSKFEKTFGLIKEGKFEEAAKEAEKSKWFKQTPARVRDFQEGIQTIRI